MKRNLLIGIGSILVIIVIYILYNRHIHSVEYSLKKIAVSIEEHDITSFKKYVDTDGVINYLIDSQLERIEKDETGEDWMSGLASGFAELFRTKMVEISNRQIQKYVETGRIPETIDKRDSTEDVSVSNIGGRLDIKNNEIVFENIVKHSKVADVNFLIEQSRFDTLLPFTIKMRDVGDYWQIFELSSFGKFSISMDLLEEKRTSELNKPIVEEMYSTLALINSKKKAYTTDSWGISKEVKVQFEIINISYNKVAKFQGVVSASDKGKNFKKIFLLNVFDISLKPNYKRLFTQYLRNMYDSDNYFLYDTPNKKLVWEFQISYIKLEDGKELKLYRKWQD